VDDALDVRVFHDPVSGRPRSVLGGVEPDRHRHTGFHNWLGSITVHNFDANALEQGGFERAFHNGARPCSGGFGQGDA
jgi:hypothetical protein